MANAIGKVSIELEARIAKLETDMGRAARIVEREMLKMRGTVQSASDKIEARAKQTGDVLKKAFNIGSTAYVARELARMADNFANINARIKLATGANANYGASLKQVLNLSMTTYQSLNATTALVQKISTNLQSTGLGATQAFGKAVALTEIFNKSLLISGAGTIQAESAMLQFSQAIAKGKLDGDEFRSVIENNSKFMQLLAKNLGVTQGELYRMREAGQLTVDTLYDLIGNTADLDAEFAKFPITISRAAQNLTSAMTAYIGGVDSAAGASRTLATGINLIAKNIEYIGPYVIGGGIIYAMAKAFEFAGIQAGKANKAIGDISKTNAATVQSKVAAEAAARAVLMEAEAKLTLAKANQETIRSYQSELTVKQRQTTLLIGLNKAQMLSDAEVAANRKALAASSNTYFSPATNRIIEQSSAALAKHEAALAAVVAQQKLQASQAALLAPLMGRSKDAAIALAAAETQVLLAKTKLTGATSDLGKAQALLPAAFAATKTAAMGLFNLIGGWPTIIAATVYAIYSIVNAERESEIQSRKTSDAIAALGQARTGYQKLVAKQDAEKEIEQSREILKGLYERRDALEALGKTLGATPLFSLAGSDFDSLDLAAKRSAELTAEIARMNAELDKNKAAFEEASNVTYEEFVSGITSLANSGAAALRGFGFDVKDVSQSLKDFNNALSAESIDDFIKDLERMAKTQRDQLVESRAGLAALLALRRAELSLKGATQDKIDEMDRLIAATVVLTESNKAQIATGKAQVKADREEISEKKKLAAELERLFLLRIKNGQKAQILAAGARGPIIEEEAKYAVAIERTNAALFKGELLYKDYWDTVNGFKAARDSEIAKIEHKIEVMEREADVVGRMIEDYDKEAMSLGLTGRALFVYEQGIIAAERAQREFNESGLRTAELTAQERAEIEAAAGAFYDHREASLDAADALESFREMAVNAYHQATDAFAGMVVDVLSGNKSMGEAFSDFGKSLVDIFKQTVAQIISEFLKLKIINPLLNSILGTTLSTGGSGSVLGSVFGGLTGGAGGGGGILGSIGSAIGGFLGLGGGAAAGFSAGVGTVGGGVGAIANFGAQVAGGGTAAAGAGGLLSGSGLGTAFAGVPIIGWIAAAMALNMSLFDQGWRPNGGTLTLPNGQGISGGGSSGGRLLDQLGVLSNPIGGLLGDRFQSLFSGSAVFTRLFGRKAPELTGSTLGINFANGQVGGTESYRTLERGGVFRSDRRRTREFDLSEESMAQAQALFDELSAVVEAAAGRLRGDAPALIDGALRVVQEFDKKGKVKSTKYFVDAIGRTWEEATEEAARTRLSAENIIATIDAIMGTTVAAIDDGIAESGDELATAIEDGVGDRVNDAYGFIDSIVKSASGPVGEASAIAERWRDSAEDLMAGAQFLLAAATDMRAGTELISGQTLTQLTDMMEDMAKAGESLLETYSRVYASTMLLDQAMALSGVNLDIAREAFVHLAADIADAAGGLDEATRLWNAYFDSFYSDSERAQARAEAAQSASNSALSGLGLDPAAFTGADGMAAFRALFEEMMPTLSADSYVSWLRAAEALALANSAQDAYNQTLETGSEAAEQSGETLADFMESIYGELEAFANPTWAERIKKLSNETESLINRAVELGATEYEINLIRELGQRRMMALLSDQQAEIAAQIAASQELNAYIANLQAEAAGGLTPLTSQLMQLRGEYEAHIQRINELAIAEGRAGASVYELGVAHDWYTAKVRQLTAALMAQAASLIQQLYGGGGTSTSGGGGGSYGGSGGGDGSPVGQALEDLYARELELLQGIQDFIDSMDTSNLSPLTPAERLASAQSNFQAVLAAAMGGDLDALANLQGAAQSYLGEAQGYYGGVGAYGGIYESVMAALQGLVGAGPQNQPGSGSGGGGGDTAGILVEPGQGFYDLSALDRFELAAQLTETLRDLIAATGMSLLEVAESLGLDLRDLVRDLGVNLDEMTVATTLQLANISRDLGVDLMDLANTVGFALGDLANSQSLLNDALEEVINGLPEGIRGQLRLLLENIEDATTEADANLAIADAEAAINLLPPDIRDALAPFFTGVNSPIDLALQEAIAQTTHLYDILQNSNGANAYLNRIAFATEASVPLPPAPSAQASVPDAASIAANIDMESDISSMSQEETSKALTAMASSINDLKAEVAGLRRDNLAIGGKVETATRGVESAIKNQPTARRG